MILDPITTGYPTHKEMDSSSLDILYGVEIGVWYYIYILITLLCFIVLFMFCAKCLTSQSGMQVHHESMETFL